MPRRRPDLAELRRMGVALIRKMDDENNHDEALKRFRAAMLGGPPSRRLPKMLLIRGLLLLALIGMVVLSFWNLATGNPLEGVMFMLLGVGLLAMDGAVNR